MQAAGLAVLAEELGLDVVGAARVEPYAETERHIRERRAHGLFADMRFTMAHPEVSCHPETLLEGARTVVSAALCYWSEGGEVPPGRGRLPRYTWSDAYAELREKLDELGRAIAGLAGKAAENSEAASQAMPRGGRYRVLVDANQHVDREAAARSGVGFYGKNTMLITRRFGSWVVLGTLVTEAELEPTPPLDLDCGSCTLCIEACPTGALDEPGVLDANRCLSYWTQSGSSIPDRYRAELGDQAYGCDICQDVCPWNRGVEKRRAGFLPAAEAEPHVSLVDWLEASDEELAERYDRLFVPRNDPRYLRRNALVAIGNAGTEAEAPLLERYAAGNDPMLREHAEWALERLGERR
jgi:epoxyqueuosine reductase